MTNLTRATLLSLATTLIFGSSAAYADHGRRSNDVEDLLLNVASAFLVTQAAQHAALGRDQHSRHGRGFHQRTCQRRQLSSNANRRKSVSKQSGNRR
ncbi:MAG: hypothetical protein O3C29_13160 [Proteobacteria bacterium]|jgi:hypothetical protein|nr:hypothetical protein [Pseudomonadota bacterium]MDA1291260.1 hypothetical protein [Pseudomonadota bacterium]